jgi:hypothetical protein
VYTSWCSDVELIEACREEFYRRLRLYQEWKAKNTKQGGPDADSRIPAALAEEGTAAILDFFHICIKIG